jgi:uncharacterized protein GlcG (DUF336 family)
MRGIVILAIAAGAPASAVGQVTLPYSTPAGPRPLIDIPAEKIIPLDQALAAAQAAQAACLAKNSPTTVQVVDLNGNIKVLLSADGARPVSFEAARRKAYTVLKKGMASGAFAKSIGSPPVTTVVEGDPNLRPSAGGVPIVKGGEIIGALAVSGPTGQADDEACARIGLEKLRL